MAVTQTDILGKGWSFPFRFSSVGRVRKVVGVTPADSIEKVKMAMRQILGTRLGSRVIDRDWGSDLRNIIFEPINQVTATRLRFAVGEALGRWERRIEVLGVSVDVSQAADGIIETSVDFQIAATQQFGNLVYPFYITPDMRVQGQILVG
jgi:phage baseplate assembly protein W